VRVREKGSREDANDDAMIQDAYNSHSRDPVSVAPWAGGHEGVMAWILRNPLQDSPLTSFPGTGQSLFSIPAAAERKYNWQQQQQTTNPHNAQQQERSACVRPPVSPGTKLAGVIRNSTEGPSQTLRTKLQAIAAIDCDDHENKAGSGADNDMENEDHVTESTCKDNLERKRRRSHEARSWRRLARRATG
jgi:hypothetical protein